MRQNYPIGGIQSQTTLNKDSNAFVPTAKAIATRLGQLMPALYNRDVKYTLKTPYTTAANRYTILTPNYVGLDVNGTIYYIETQQEIDLSIAANWDSVATDYTVAATRAGLDFYLYACEPASGNAPAFVLSVNSTTPTGYTADNSRKIGGFHCLCVAVGTIAGHTLTNFVAGDVLPASVWDLKHRPSCDLGGMAYDEKSDFWSFIYLASGTGASTASVYGGTISDTRNWMDFVDDGGAVGVKMLTDEQFQLMAAGSNEETNIAGATDPGDTGGHSDTAGRRMISNIGCEDCCGVIWQWLSEQSYRFDGGSIGLAVASKTSSVTYVATPGGNQIYLKFDTDGIPYLSCNMANDAVDKIITLGTDYKITIRHDVGANTGLAVYFDDDATQPSRILVNNTILSKDCYAPTNHPQYLLKIKHDASAATNGTALNFDDGADERLESACAGTANADIDLTILKFSDPSWSYENITGVKGSLYKQGTYGDVKLLAGVHWNSATDAGSRARASYGCRWNANSDVGGRFGAEPRKTA